MSWVDCRQRWGVRALGVVDGMVLLLALLFWTATAYKVRELRKRPAPAQRSLTLTILSLAVAATFLVPVVHVCIGRLTGVANIAEPVARTAVLVAACAGQALVLRLTAEDGFSRMPVARRTAGVGVVVVGLWSLFIVAPVETSTIRFTSQFGSDPMVAAYLALALGYLAWALIDIRRGCRRYATEASGFLAQGLRLIGRGCLIGLMYIAVKGAALVALAVGSPLPVELEATVGRSLAVLAGTLVIVGSTLPATGPAVGSWLSWLTAYRDLRRLYPLWIELVSVTPDIALDPAGSRLRDALRFRDLDMHVYRRVIEIRDGRLALRPYLDAAVEGSTRLRMREAPDREADAAVEAYMLRAAAEAARAHRRPVQVAEGQGFVGRDLEDELSWFSLVARCYRQGGWSASRPSLPQPAWSTVRAS